MEDVTVDLTEAREKTGKKRGIPGSTLKLLAIFVMLIDHIAAVVLINILISVDFFSMGSAAYENPTYQLMNAIYSNMRMIGRLGFPLFCFLLVEGFVHTRNKLKYVIRLALFCLLSEIPFDLAFSGQLFYMGYQNVFFTLLIGFVVMWGFQGIAERLKGMKWLPVISFLGAAGGGYIVATVWRSGMFTVNNITVLLMGKQLPEFMLSYNNSSFNIAALVSTIILLITYLAIRKTNSRYDIIFADLLLLACGMQLADLLRTDYSAFGILTIAVFYAFRRKPFRSALAGCIILNIMTLNEYSAFFTLLPIGKYNGERGLRLKYVFYAFYPVHLLILYIICRFMKII